MPSTIFLDLEAGSDAADGTSFANRKKTLAGASAIALPGDTVNLMASTTPNSLGVNGTFARGSPSITLASAVNATIENCENNWTPVANVSSSQKTQHKQGTFSINVVPSTSFTTGLAAYKTISSTDFSAYQQISFWMQQDLGTLSGFTIKLCSDTAGVTAVDTFSIPAAVVLNGWNRVTVNKGSAMGAAIQSIAVYVDSDLGAQSWVLDNIVACKAPGTGELTHKTLIGKANSLGAGGDDSETWYAIRTIEGTTITLDLLNSSNAGSTTNGRYWGTSETVTAYSLFPSYVPTSVVSADLMWTAGGTDTQTLTISGGWNRTDMTTQTGQTWLAVGNQPSTGLAVAIVAAHLDVSRLQFAGGTTQNGAWTINNSAIATMHCIGFVGNTINGNNITITKLTQANGTTGVTIGGINIVAGLAILSDQSNFSLGGSLGSTFTIDSNSISSTFATPGPASKLIFNGTTYGSFGEASAAAAVNATALTESYRANGATGTLTQLLYEILAHLAEKSISGTTLTTKKIDHSTTAAVHTLDSATSPTSITRSS